jgi:hypothetical protein
MLHFTFKLGLAIRHSSPQCNAITDVMRMKLYLKGNYILGYFMTMSSLLFILKHVYMCALYPCTQFSEGTGRNAMNNTCGVYANY